MFEPMVYHETFDWRQSGTVDGRWFVVDYHANVLLVDGDVPSGGVVPVESDNVHLLGIERGQPVWAVSGGGTIPEGGEWVGLRKLYGVVPERDWALAGRAAQIMAWDRDHRYCGRCGRPTEHHERDRARRCSSCDLLAYPRLNPAVIMLVERDDDGRALLAWGRQFPVRFYSALAGFVEPGESLEAAVAREVAEEVGIEIGEISYFGSQPWPFPHSIMIGFSARYRGGELRYQDDEIIEAGWFAPDDLPPAPRGGMSIAGWLIDDWIERRTAG